MNDDLLLRFLMKQCSDEDIRAIDTWISLSPENAKWLFEIEKIWTLKYELKYSDKNQINEAFQEFINQVEHKQTQITSIKKAMPWYKYIAAAIIIVLLSMNIYQHIQPTAIGKNELYVPTGEMANLTLSDGTKVWLNAESKLIYASSFSSDERNVTLIGEAYFEVMHNKDSPFIVHTKDLATVVLGTSFNIKAYEDEESRVTLIEGVVKVEASNKYLILKPNQRAEFSKNGDLILQDIENSTDLKQWTTGELVFINESLRNIATILERKFGVKVTIRGNQLADEIYSSRIQKNTSLYEVLEILKATRNFNYEIKENNILLFN